MITVELLDSSLETDWEALLQSSKDIFVYHSLPYRNALLKILEGAEPFYLCAKEDGRLVGVLPAFLMRSEYGAVLNSLPFFGSHGQPVISLQAENPGYVRAALVKELTAIAREKAVVAATIIGHPLDQGDEELRSMWAPDLEDYRIGQITQLHTLREGGDPKETLMQMCHSKTRNMIRKGLRGGFTTSWRTDASILGSLQKLHEANMQAIGGVAKPKKVFAAIADALQPGTEWRVWVSERDGSLAAALLCLYYNRTVEYFTPAIAAEYRGEQPLSSLIYEAMVDASARQFNYWNWGGTWTSQNGVYLFKSRWGTLEAPYRYYIKVMDDRVRDFSREQLASAFPYFYVIPYSELRQAETAQCN